MVMTSSKGMSSYSDIHYTKPEVSKFIIDYFSPTGKVLEPFKGGGAFYDHLPKGTSWAEIDDGIDFFKIKSQFDWIVTNPPFSNLTEVMEHAFSISENVIFLVPMSKIYSSVPRMNLVKNVAGIKTELYLGSGRKIGFDIGFPFAAFEFVRGYKGKKTFVDAEDAWLKSEDKK